MAQTLKKKPVNGMKDILPREMEIRDYVTGIIKDTYRSFGFTPIATPCMEEIGNLQSNQGGENEKLIFKVLKRGEKLHIAEAESEADVVDYGLRYDLTLPLTRFYSNNINDLPNPFKALQIGNVWRADRPQRGRFRQFTQCDIDIFGEPTNLAEIELILATTATLGKIGFKGFEIRINDRQLLNAMARYAGFSDQDTDEVFVILDKMDKIGLDGVKEELCEKYEASSVDRFLSLFDDIKGNVQEGTKVLEKKLEGFLDGSVTESLRQIDAAVSDAKEADFEMVFDPTLVRGMGYYTGTIFEIAIPEFGGSCGGGGRYDRMVGRFTGHDVSACGFSIGFERIIMLLMEHDFKIPDRAKKVAYLIDKSCPADKYADIMKEASALRAGGEVVLVVRRNKNAKFQKEQLKKQGYEEFKEFFND
jgi:histidyl-tRNA synthetase